MIIGIPKEIKDNEYRVSLVPSGVSALTELGHSVLVESGAGVGSGLPDQAFTEAGAEIRNSAAEVFAAADLIVKVKEPQPSEYDLLRAGQIVLTFFHLAADRALFDAIIESNITAIAYETIEDDNGSVPILIPMSEVAGRLSVQIGANYLVRPAGKRGVLLGGVPGVEKGRVVIVGAGTVGLNAIKIAVGFGAEVTVLDSNIESFRHLDDLYGGEVETLASNTYNIERASSRCDLLVGAVHLPGARTPSIVTREMVSNMRAGAVIIDVSVDQGGCVETTRPTTHSNPIFEEAGVIHYGVTNMPGSVPRTSTFALTNITLPYIVKLAGGDLRDATKEDSSLKRGVNIHRGKVTNKAVAGSFKVEYTPLENLI